MKVGMIRCKKTEERCSAHACINAMKDKESAFEGISEEIEIIGVNNCGGCPGDKVVERALRMIRIGQADTIAFSSCMTRPRPGLEICPNHQKMAEDLRKRLSEGVKIVDMKAVYKKIGQIEKELGIEEARSTIDIQKIECEFESSPKKLGEGLNFFDHTHYN